MFIHLHQFGKQMVETPLLCQGFDFVVSTPEVTDQDALEQEMPSTCLTTGDPRPLVIR